jgi:ATP-dependent DNA ligase
MRDLRRRLSAERSTPPFDPCLPRSAKQPPTGPGWLHEIKHDGFRILAYRQGRTIHLITRNGHDLADRFLLAAEAVAALPVRSCVIDGEAIVCDDSGLAVFDLIRGHGRTILCVFDLLEVTTRTSAVSQSRTASAAPANKDMTRGRFRPISSIATSNNSAIRRP